ncbi:MAG TPA: Npt1/Npt2 family nucleotide transporter [Longimicrobiales bacterium]|nr:Npt1/Npt2 family nucleotide transporter [Longimicrobiales bacterium]
MGLLKRYFPDFAGPNRRDLPRLLAMMALFFLVVCAVGILRPIKNALALDGLGGTDFYKVYLVSAVVILFVPLYNKLSDRIAARWLIPLVAASFAVELVLFRVFYIPGSTAFGMIFYGWYDLFAAALVSQFFMATQLFFNARSAKQAYPVVIAGGSIGATLGSAITGFFVERVGTPQLLLVAAALIALFAAALPLAWGTQAPPRLRREPNQLDSSVLRNRQVRLIAVGVMLTILVKQVVDYQFNFMTDRFFQERDAMAAFQGKFNVITQWLPIVALAALQPALRRYGVGLTVMLLPFAMLLTNVGLVLWWGLWAATAAKAAETSLRYSAERASREILYVPVPDEIKLKAKAYIDVAIEKGIGKAGSAVLLVVLATFLTPRQVIFVAIGLTVLWLITAYGMRREYVHTLARSIEGRFASLRGGFASLADPGTSAAVRRALAAGDRLQVAFALDLASQAAPRDLAALTPQLHALLGHPDEAVRAKALQVLARSPALDRNLVRARLTDAADSVREAAVEALCANGNAEEVIGELLQSSSARDRRTALACLSRGVVAANTAQWLTKDYIDGHRAAARAGDREARLEVALAAANLNGSGEAVGLLRELAADSDPTIRNAALLSAGRLQSVELRPILIAALADPRTRCAARDALVAQGAVVTEPLTQSLLDTRTPNRIRREIPAVLSHLPSPETVQTLIRSYLAPETDQLLDYRTVKALSKLRARNRDLPFEREAVLEALRREITAAADYERVQTAIAALGANSPAVKLLDRALTEAWSERCESAFRLLGLLYPPDAIRDCYNALHNGTPPSRANALEWLETNIGHELFQEMQPLVRERASEIGREPTATQALAALEHDNDIWIARLARRAATELNGASTTAVQRGDDMDLIEKVFLLQQVDLLQGARSAHLALLATIAQVQDIAADTVLIKENESTSAMYVVVRGAVELRDRKENMVTMRDNGAFGTWALIDRAPSLVAARTLEPTRVLRIDQEDFDDLLNEHPELALGLLQGLARRVRAIVA